MQLSVEIVCAGEPGPPDGAPVIVQIRDTGMADASSTTLSEARVEAHACRAGEALARAQVDVPASGGSPTVWVHVDVDRSGDVSKGDYITMQSYPVRGGGAMRVEVRRV